MVRTIQLNVVSADAMRRLGQALGRAARAGDLFLLQGPLGAGKTTFVQGLARGLDVSADVSSPSFVIEHQYPGRLTLYHVDLYRLEQPERELLESLDEDLYGDGVAAVEWAERLPPAYRHDATLLQMDVDGASRTVTIHASDERLLAAAEAARA